RTLLNRDREANVLTFHPSLRAKFEVTPRELVLSRAILLASSPLQSFATSLARSFDMVLVKDSHREARLAGIADSLADGDITFGDLEALLQVADIGVTTVRIEESNIPERIRLAVQRFQRDLRKGDAPSSDDASDSEADKPEEELESDDLEQVARHLLFTHRGLTDDCPPFSLSEESDGTIAWLAIAVPALEALRR